MRLVIARCTVDYAGRLTAHLPSAVRLLLVKADGSVSVHADDRAYKPLNWMNPPCSITEEPGRWLVRSPKCEELEITIEEGHSDTKADLGVEPGLQKDGVEAHLQELLATDPAARSDVAAFCRMRGHELVETVDEDTGVTAYLVRRA